MRAAVVQRRMQHAPLGPDQFVVHALAKGGGARTDGRCVLAHVRPGEAVSHAYLLENVEDPEIYPLEAFETIQLGDFHAYEYWHNEEGIHFDEEEAESPSADIGLPLLIASRVTMCSLPRAVDGSGRPRAAGERVNGGGVRLVVGRWDRQVG